MISLQGPSWTIRDRVAFSREGRDRSLLAILERSEGVAVVKPAMAALAVRRHELDPCSGALCDLRELADEFGAVHPNKRTQTHDRQARKSYTTVRISRILCPGLSELPAEVGAAIAKAPGRELE